MKFHLPSKALPRLARLVAAATTTDGSSPLVARLSIRHEDGSELGEEEAREIRAVLAGYEADGALDDRVETNGRLPK